MFQTNKCTENVTSTSAMNTHRKYSVKKMFKFIAKQQLQWIHFILEYSNKFTGCVCVLLQTIENIDLYERFESFSYLYISSHEQSENTLFL